MMGPSRDRRRDEAAEQDLELIAAHRPSGLLSTDGARNRFEIAKILLCSFVVICATLVVGRSAVITFRGRLILGASLRNNFAKRCLCRGADPGRSIVSRLP
jgi:hypothetical protein